MRLLDLFCGAGGAAMGYYRAGFTEIVGVDIKPQPRYPFTFVQGDALEYVRLHGAEFDAIHASPPCQAYSIIRRGVWQSRKHPELIQDVRDALRNTGRPYVIENVVGAPLQNPLMLCGSMFGLGVWRHRIFEGVAPFAPAACRHDYVPVPVYGHSGAGANRGRERAAGRTNTGADWRAAMGIDWMTNSELAQAIPPAYTEYIGRQLLAALGAGGGR